MKSLFIAYTVIWIVLFAYLFNIDLKQRALSKEIAALKKKLFRGENNHTNETAG